MMILLALLACDDLLLRGGDGSASDLPPASFVSRLNRAEYNNTVRDLFGTTMTPARDFPADDFAQGFDTISEVLSVSPLHVELYQRAATGLIDELYGQRAEPVEQWVLEAESAEATGGADWESTAWILFETDSVYDSVYLPKAGSYTVATRAWTRGGTPGDLELRVDGMAVTQSTVQLDARVEHTLDLSAGLHTVEVRYLHEPVGVDDDELIVDWMEITGPHGLMAPPPAGRDAVLTCEPGLEVREVDCAQEILGAFARRAWRRGLSPVELEGLFAVYGEARAHGGGFDEGIQGALQAILMSPHFLYRLEFDRGTDGLEPISGYALASRLSYFLWSSMPDDRLLDLAASGALTEPVVLEAEARRMLDDPRAIALVDNLGGQWLGIRKVEEAQPDPVLFPEADAALRRGMEAELTALVASVFLGDEPIEALLTSTTATIDARLAEHYGQPSSGVVELVDRPGLMSRGGWLMATSHPTRTSPTKRGAWVLDKVLCSPPPPAPPNIPAIDEEAGDSVLEQLKAHTSDPSCAGCHTLMDPIGIGLETFGVLGDMREDYADGQPVIATASFDDGTTFDGPVELMALLAQDPRVHTCVVQQAFTYALGRGPSVADTDVLEELEADLRSSHSFRELVVDIVGSTPFRTRRGSP